jgi:hypothetical protein
MSIQKDTTWARAPKAVRYFNAGIAGVLYVLGIYHYTQPDAAWRSGTIEIVTASCLLAAVYLLPLKAAAVINIIFSLMLTVLGIRHAAIGGGWISGTIELIFAGVLVYGAVMINRKRKKKSTADSFSPDPSSSFP